ncbi:MAG: TlpA family protein disulfide reductase [Deltaproteobacteria bacterium]|nr:TlpA family protein disulfide reductase [Deltaproteobacteria bacterium]
MLLVGAGCDQGRAGTPGLKRNEAVLASGPSGAVQRDAASAAAAPGQARTRTLCAGAPLARPLPAGRLAQAAAPGALPLGDRIVTPGAWTWISLWAAWCKPCIDEIPRLLGWQTRLNGALRVRFLSLDDDERQLRRMLESQPAGGMRASHWLPEGRGRDAWLAAVGIKTEPTLPVQILVNPRGGVHCIVEGAIEDGDFERVAAIVQGRP